MGRTEQRVPKSINSSAELSITSVNLLKCSLHIFFSTHPPGVKLIWDPSACLAWSRNLPMKCVSHGLKEDLSIAEAKLILVPK